MVKRQSIDKDKVGNLYKTTAPEQLQEAAPKDEVRSSGVGLYKSEWARVDAIAAELGQTRHAVAAYALKDFLRRWEAGEIQTETKPSLPGLD